MEWEGWEMEVRGYGLKLYTLDMRQNPLIQLYSYRAKKCYRAIRALQCLDSSFVSQTLSISWSLNDGDFRRNIGVFQKISGIKVEETKEPLTLWTKDTRKQDNLFKNIQVYQHNQGVCQQGQFFYWSEAVRAIYGKYIVLTNESLSWILSQDQ